MGHNDGDELTLLRTVNNNEWSIYADNFNFAGMDLGINETRKMVVDPMAPYIFMPYDDFSSLSIELQSIYNSSGLDLQCSSRGCFINSDCKTLQDQTP